MRTLEISKLGLGKYYMCVMKEDENAYIHQGIDYWLQVEIYPPLLPLWLQIILIVILLSLSGLFSGLNLGLMALDPTELKILQNVGNPKEKQHAKKISPVRKYGNYLLCSLLLGNVLVNTTLTVLLDDLSSGLWAVLGATAGIVIFGEIVPQAICSRHGLAVGARTVYLTKFFMFLTFPISFPVSKILDFILGKEIGSVVTRERLIELIRVTEEYNDLQKEEMDIISGALELQKTTVKSVMTPLSDCYMLDEDAILDFKTVTEIMNKGFTRIPVFSQNRDNIVALLFVKDLAFVDPDDCTPLKTVIKFYQHPINFVFEDTTLDVILSEFKKGQSHMAIVNRVNSDGLGDPFYEVMGLVTLEDVIEEIIQAEIVDETDIYRDNRSKAPIGMRMRRDFSRFAHQEEGTHIKISPQLALATFQFLSTGVEAFKTEFISENILHRLLEQDIIIDVRLEDKNKPVYIFQRGHPADYFVLILQGRVEVAIGNENLIFEQGPFGFFGQNAILPPGVKDRSNSTANSESKASLQSIGSFSSGHGPHPQFIPDFTVRILTDVQYMRVSRFQYKAARTATLVDSENKANSPSQTKDVFSMEWKKATNTEANAKGSILGIDKDESGSIADIMQVQVGNETVPETTC
ncbi:metal transporter CNNM2-like isoform X2 [Amphiura filiformis]|uniref:metal transporter CNNM2-like isoform X2 n=1 Tax=Amphiura filiformis TaxID=82378 RepID=UPI003B21942F